jgi:hypothetical protein
MVSEFKFVSVLGQGKKSRKRPASSSVSSTELPVKQASLSTEQGHIGGRSSRRRGKSNMSS